MWSRLLDQPPARVFELAAALGVTVADLPTRATFQYRWDPFHEEPVRTIADMQWRDLTHYAVSFPEGRAACERRLAGALAKWFYVRPGEGDAFTLEWFAEQPDWAKAPVDEEARAAALRSFAAGLAAGSFAVPAAAGIAAAPDALRLEFDPPIPALVLARALGAAGVVARTIDVHMSHWVLALEAGSTTARLTAGGWEVVADLRGRPTGGPAEGLTAPAAAVALLSDADLVGGLRLRPL